MFPDASIALEIAFLFIIVAVNRLAFVYVVNKRLHLTFVKNPVLTFVYFMGMTAIIALLFRSYALAVLHPASIITVMFFLFMLFVVNPWVYKRLKETGNLPTRLARMYPEQAFLSIDSRYLLSKTGDVIFQQVSLGILLFILSALGIPLDTLVPLFALTFAFFHAHLFLSMPAFWAAYFAICAAAGGFVIPFVLLSVPGGIYYTVVLHMLWYVGSGAMFGSIEKAEREAARKRL